MIKVLIVDDSRTVSKYLHFVLEHEADMEVIGIASNGKEAIDFLEQQKPDIITMDIDMPVMDGLVATRQIMASTPIPIIILTAMRSASEEDLLMEALAAGALTLLRKPEGIEKPRGQADVRRLISYIRTYSQVRVVTRNSSAKKQQPPAKSSSSALKSERLQVYNFLNKKYVAIGISTGGPQVFAKIFERITADFPYPILVVQHITEGFLGNMVCWLNRNHNIPVTIAANNQILQPGNVYFAPNQFHMGVSGNRIQLTPQQPADAICPSVAHLFDSLAEKQAKGTIAMLLTGMGRDGAAELKILRNNGALTLAQDEESAMVFGMPGEAIKMGAAQYIVSTDQIANLLAEIEKHSK